jgi:hypothetical protein
MKNTELFDFENKYYICTNKEAFKTNESEGWEVDGSSVGLEDYKGEVLVGMNFSCPHFHIAKGLANSEQYESADELVDLISQLHKVLED